MASFRAFNLAILLLFTITLISASSVNAQNIPASWSVFQVNTHLVLSGKIVHAELLPETEETYSIAKKPRIKMTVAVSDVLFLEPEVASFDSKPEIMEIYMPDGSGVVPVGNDATFFATRFEGKWVTLFQVGVWPHKSIRTSHDKGKTYSRTIAYDLTKLYIANLPSVFENELIEPTYKLKEGRYVEEFEGVMHYTQDSLKTHLKDQLLNKTHPLILKARKEILAEH